MCIKQENVITEKQQPAGTRFSYQNDSDIKSDGECLVDHFNKSVSTSPLFQAIGWQESSIARNYAQYAGDEISEPMRAHPQQSKSHTPGR